MLENLGESSGIYLAFVFSGTGGGIHLCPILYHDEYLFWRESTEGEENWKAGSGDTSLDGMSFAVAIDTNVC